MGVIRNIAIMLGYKDALNRNQKITGIIVICVLAVFIIIGLMRRGAQKNVEGLSNDYNHYNHYNHMQYYHTPQYISGDQIAGRKSGRMNVPIHRVVMPSSSKGEFVADFNQLHFK